MTSEVDKIRPRPPALRLKTAVLRRDRETGVVIVFVFYEPRGESFPYRVKETDVASIKSLTPAAAAPLGVC